MLALHWDGDKRKAGVLNVLNAWGVLISSIMSLWWPNLKARRWAAPYHNFPKKGIPHDLFANWVTILLIEFRLLLIVHIPNVMGNMMWGSCVNVGVRTLEGMMSYNYIYILTITWRCNLIGKLYKWVNMISLPVHSCFWCNGAWY